MITTVRGVGNPLCAGLILLSQQQVYFIFVIVVVVVVVVRWMGGRFSVA